MRTDFNDAMANIDQGVAQAAVVPFAVGSYVRATAECTKIADQKLKPSRT